MYTFPGFGWCQVSGGVGCQVAGLAETITNSVKLKVRLEFGNRSNFDRQTGRPNHNVKTCMGQFLQDGIFGPRTSKIWSSSRTAADYKIDLPNIFLASLICISTMFLRKIDD